MKHWLFLPSDAIKDVTTLARLSLDQFRELQRLLDSSESRPSYAFYVKVSDTLNISDDEAGNLCTFITYVQRQRTRLKQSSESVPSELERFLDRSGKPELIEKIRERRNALVSLFSDSPGQVFSTKMRGLENGPLPHLHQFRTFCDVRPVFDGDGSKIVSCFPIITCWFVVHESESHETKEFLFQITEDDLKDITGQFDRLETKLAEMRRSFSSFLAKKVEE